MYNRYIPHGTPYESVAGRNRPSAHGGENQHQTHTTTRRPPPPPPPKGRPLEGITGWLGGLLKQIHLEDLDSGDILLVLILLFLFLESDDNLELVITLGLLLVFGLFGKDEPSDED